MEALSHFPKVSQPLPKRGRGGWAGFASLVVMCLLFCRYFDANYNNSVAFIREVARHHPQVLAVPLMAVLVVCCAGGWVCSHGRKPDNPTQPKAEP